jgi:hypothetical protein
VQNNGSIHAHNCNGTKSGPRVLFRIQGIYTVTRRTYKVFLSFRELRSGEAITGLVENFEKGDARHVSGHVQF